MRAHPLLFAIFCSCAPSVEADFDAVEITYPDLAAPAYLGPTNSAVIPQVSFSFELDSKSLGASSIPANQNRIQSAAIYRLALVAKAGVSDLSFLRTVQIVASLPPSRQQPLAPTPQILIANYTRADESPVGGIFHMPIPMPVNILPLLRPNQSDQRKIVVTFTVGGTLPRTGWKADVVMGMSASLKD